MTKKCCLLEHNYHVTPIPSHPILVNPWFSVKDLHTLCRFWKSSFFSSISLVSFSSSSFLSSSSFANRSCSFLSWLIKKDKSKEITLLFYHNRAIMECFSWVQVTVWLRTGVNPCQRYIFFNFNALSSNQHFYSKNYILFKRNSENLAANQVAIQVLNFPALGNPSAVSANQ